ncbi:MAG: DUF362 domain-containing protein [Candidatus Lokiarchaeota archaeon]|nr:DUF362 domain-containing protein [Candidatus Lokiarchaeota archaeon]
MKSDVYYLSARASQYQQSMSRFKGPLALKQVGFENKMNNHNKVVIKTHFGALENTRYIRPSYIRFLCDYVKSLGGYPAVAESCGWGVPGATGEYGGRANEEEYLDVALKHGFTAETMGAPIFMLDGPEGLDYIIQNIDGKYFNEVRVAGRLKEYDYMILASHFKGHSSAGFGGAIKNLGIGCVAKGGKVEAHTGKKFEFDFDKCLPDCNKCIEICPTGALKRNENNDMEFNEQKCRYCYMCKSVCKHKAVDIGTVPREQFIYQMVDNAKGVVDYFDNDKIFYINYAIDITWQCDCSGSSDVPFVSDIGILSSKDPVALDQACVDLTHASYMNQNSILGEIKSLKSSEKGTWFSYIPRYEENELFLNKEGISSDHWKIQLDAAERIGLGTRDYELIPIKIELEE